MSATANVATGMGAGHRTIAVPASPPSPHLDFPLGLEQAETASELRTAGTSVSATATATNMPTAQGAARV